MEETQKANQEVEIASREAKKVSEKVYTIKIKSDADLSNATQQLSEIKKMYKDIDKRRKAITAPLTKSIKDVNALFKSPLDQLSDAEKLIKEAMIAYQAKVEAKAAKKADKIENAVDAGELDMSKGMAKLSNIKQAPQGVETESGSASFKTVKKIKITDVSLLPPSYFIRQRVLEALRQEVEEDYKRGVPIPAGAEQYEEKQVAVRIF